MRYIDQPELRVVVYRKRGEGTEMREVTSNVAVTIAMLQAQGCIIIDIIDIGWEHH